MIRLVEVFCATRRHQKKKKNETQTKVRMALQSALYFTDVAFREISSTAFKMTR